jgi:hypothetical protein
VDDFKKVAEDFNAKGEICKKNGIRFTYHNHEYGFNLIDDQYPQDNLMKNTTKWHEVFYCGAGTI